MSRENVEVVRRVYGEWGRWNFREGAELYDPHVLLVVRPEFGLASGRGRVLRPCRGGLERAEALEAAGLAE